MFRNPPKRRRSAAIAEDFDSPLYNEPFDGVNLWALMEETFHEAAVAARGTPKIGKTERTAHMAIIQDVFKTQISQLAQEKNPATADDVYNLIVRTLKAAENKGISTGEIGKVIGVMDGIRDAWTEDPDGLHNIGPHRFYTEKENLASYFSQWMVAGLVGSAKYGDPRPAHGSHGWSNAPDSGNDATGGRRPSGPPREPGHTDINRARIAGHGVVGHGESRQRGQTIEEAIDNLANRIPEDVNETWDLLAEDGQVAPMPAAAPAASATPTPPAAPTGSDPQQAAADFAEADKAAGIVKAKLESLAKANALTPDMKQKFQQFVQSLNASLSGQAPAATA